MNILYYIRIVLGGALPRGPTNDYEPSIEVIILNITFQQNSFPGIKQASLEHPYDRDYVHGEHVIKRSIDSGKRESKPSFSALTDKILMFSLVDYDLPKIKASPIFTMCN